MWQQKRERRGGIEGILALSVISIIGEKSKSQHLIMRPSRARAERHHNQHRGVDVAVDSAAPGAKLLSPPRPTSRARCVARGKTLTSEKWGMQKHTTRPCLLQCSWITTTICSELCYHRVASKESISTDLSWLCRSLFFILLIA